MAGARLPTHEGYPEPGWYVTRITLNGPLYPASIWLYQEIGENGELIADEHLVCDVAGSPADPYEQWVNLARLPIFQEEYDELCRQLLLPRKYIGPLRPFVRWLDPAEVAADWLRYTREREIA